MPPLDELELLELEDELLEPVLEELDEELELELLDDELLELDEELLELDELEGALPLALELEPEPELLFAAGGLALGLLLSLAPPQANSDRLRRLVNTRVCAAWRSFKNSMFIITTARNCFRQHSEARGFSESDKPEGMARQASGGTRC